MSCPICAKPRPAAAYIRVSTQDQAKKGYSLPEQRDQAARKAAELGFCSRCLVVYEDVHSGSEMERPAFERLREAVRRGLHDVVICLCPDRLGRNTVGMLLAYEELKAYGVRVEYVQISVDGDTPEGNLFLQISAVFSDYERRKIISRIRAGKERKVRQTGRLPHRVRLYGYRFNEETDLLEVDPEEAETVRRIFRWAAWGDGGGKPLNPAQICARLDALGIPRSDGGRGWYPSSVIRMVRREAYYTGRFITHRWANRERTVERPPEEQHAVAIEPLVDAATWRLANAHLASGRSGRGLSPVPYPLQGAVVCGECGRPMHTKSSRPRGRLFRYYHCPDPGPGAGGGPCPVWWNADRLEDAIWQVVRRLIAGPGQRAAAAATAEGDGLQNLRQERDELQARLRRTEEKLVRAARLAVEAIVGEAELRRAVAPLLEERERLVARLDAVAACLRDLEARRTAPDGAAEARRRFGQALRAGDPALRERALAALVTEVRCWPDGRLEVKGYLPPAEAELTLGDDGRFALRSPIEKRAIEKLQALMGDRRGAGGMV